MQRLIEVRRRVGEASRLGIQLAEQAVDGKKRERLARRGGRRKRLLCTRGCPRQGTDRTVIRRPEQVPGGPVEQMVAQLKGRDAGGVGEGPSQSAGVYRGRQGVDAARVEEIKKLYGFDKTAPERSLQMLRQFSRFALGKRR